MFIVKTLLPHYLPWFMKKGFDPYFSTALTGLSYPNLTVILQNSFLKNSVWPFINSLMQKLYCLWGNFLTMTDRQTLYNHFLGKQMTVLLWLRSVLKHPSLKNQKQFSTIPSKQTSIIIYYLTTPSYIPISKSRFLWHLNLCWISIVTYREGGTGKNYLQSLTMVYLTLSEQRHLHSEYQYLKVFFPNMEQTITDNTKPLNGAHLATHRHISFCVPDFKTEEF